MTLLYHILPLQKMILSPKIHSVLAALS